MGGFVLAPLLVDNLFGYSVSAISLLMLIRPAVFSASAPVGGNLASRIGERPVAIFGAAASAIRSTPRDGAVDSEVSRARLLETRP